MTTDNWPVDFYFVSRRLVKQIVDQHQAVSGKRKASLTLGPPWAKVALSESGPDRENLFDLVRRSTQAVRDNTGTLESPGAYVEMTLRFRPSLFTVHQGFQNWNSDFAGFFADEDVPGIGRVLVTLFGSTSNFLGRVPEQTGLGWNPSDAAGLYVLLSNILEESDHEVRKDFLEEDRQVTDVALQAIVAAETISRLVRVRFPPAVLTTLAVVHAYERNLTLGSRTYERVVVGAPVWVATPIPQAQSAI